MEELKAATFQAHARVQITPFFEALTACQLPLESYVGQLRALTVIHRALEHLLENCPDERVSCVWTRDMARLPFLLQDLQYFEPRMVADLKEAVERARKIAEHLQLRALEQPLTLLGYLYVLEGSTLGAVVLKPVYARAFLLTGTEGLLYLHSDVPGVYARWARYRERMNALRLSHEERELLTKAASDFFIQAEGLLKILYPFKAESKTFLLSTINPDAGQHPVPVDAKEAEAAVKAGDKCWARFPYYQHRFGERGLRFARSDAAWLAALVPYEPAQVMQQVRWLGRVLAGRGMPTILLQIQLEMLAEMLSGVFPERTPQYEKLLLASVDLHSSRCRYLPDHILQTLSAAFDRGVGAEWSVRFPSTGDMLVCAVADEMGGNEGAVESLRQWMTDPVRFPAVWIDAVEATLIQARKQAKARPQRP